MLGRKSRYRPLAYGKSLPDILDRLASPEMEFVTQHLGYRIPSLVIAVPSFARANVSLPVLKTTASPLTTWDNLRIRKWLS